MTQQPAFWATFTGGLWRFCTDFLVLGAVGGVGLGLWRAFIDAPPAAFQAALSYLAACAWLAFNFSALALLILAVTAPGRPNRWFIFALACAKLPLSYLALFWLFTGGVFAPVYLAAGVASLPLVLVCRGIADARAGRK